MTTRQLQGLCTQYGRPAPSHHHALANLATARSPLTKGRGTAHHLARSRAKHNHRAYKKHSIAWPSLAKTSHVWQCRPQSPGQTRPNHWWPGSGLEIATPRCHAGLDHGQAATDVSGRSADTSVEAVLQSGIALVSGLKLEPKSPSSHPGRKTGNCIWLIWLIWLCSPRCQSSHCRRRDATIQQDSDHIRTVSELGQLAAVQTVAHPMDCNRPRRCEHPSCG